MRITLYLSNGQKVKRSILTGNIEQFVHGLQQAIQQKRNYEITGMGYMHIFSAGSVIAATIRFSLLELLWIKLKGKHKKEI